MQVARFVEGVIGKRQCRVGLSVWSRDVKEVLYGGSRVLQHLALMEVQIILELHRHWHSLADAQYSGSPEGGNFRQARLPTNTT